jgi:hypothetical protein
MSYSRRLWEKIDRPSQRREMAGVAVARRGASIALACRTFGVSETCIRFKANIADFLGSHTAKSYYRVQYAPRNFTSDCIDILTDQSP